MLGLITSDGGVATIVPKSYYGSKKQVPQRSPQSKEHQQKNQKPCSDCILRNSRNHAVTLLPQEMLLLGVFEFYNSSLLGYRLCFTSLYIHNNSGMQCLTLDGTCEYLLI